MQEASLTTLAAFDWRDALGPILIGVGLLAGGVILGAWAWRRARAARGDATSPPKGPAQRDEIEGVTRDVEELAQRLAAELDRRADRIERLIAAADQRIAALDRPRTPLAPPASRTEPPHDAAPVQSLVFQLADEGLPIVEIARRVQHPTGQVELMLALRRGKIGL